MIPGKSYGYIYQSAPFPRYGWVDLRNGNECEQTMQYMLLLHREEKVVLFLPFLHLDQAALEMLNILLVRFRLSLCNLTGAPLEMIPAIFTSSTHS